MCIRDRGIAVDCGVRCLFEETFVANIRAIRSLRGAGANVCGIVPRNTYVRDLGFVDGLLVYKQLGESHSFRLARGIEQSKI